MSNWLIRLLFGEPRKSLQGLYDKKLNDEFMKLIPNYTQIFSMNIGVNKKGNLVIKTKKNGK